MRARRELVLRAQRGDVLAMDRLLERILPLVTSICDRLAGAAGADATQDALLLVFRKLKTLEQPDALTTWVATTARREALRHARQGNKDRRSATPLHDAQVTADRHDTVELHDGLASLPFPQREVLILRDLVGLSERETAELLGLARGTVKSRLHRARATFREAWIG